MKTKEILLGVTGSIAAYKACDIIRRLQDKGCRPTVIMTKSAEEFIAPLTLANLSGRKVYRKMFENVDEGWSAEHISLVQAAQCLVIAPATANIIGKIANGIADDLLSCTAMTIKKKIFIAPAMNTAANTVASTFRSIAASSNGTRLILHAALREIGRASRRAPVTAGLSRVRTPLSATLC